MFLPRDIIVNWCVVKVNEYAWCTKLGFKETIEGEERREEKDRSIECWAPKHTIQAAAVSRQYILTQLYMVICSILRVLGGT